jgi:hypothetical protein
MPRLRMLQIKTATSIPAAGAGSSAITVGLAILPIIFVVNLRVQCNVANRYAPQIVLGSRRSAPAM